MKRPGGTGFNEFSLGYEYDTGGNITKVTHSTNTAWNASYTYDSQNQLTQEVNKNGTYNYTYDTGGNIRSVSGAETHTYTYGDSEWLDLLTAYDGKSITYDTIGNPAVWHNGTGDWNLSWSNGRQLTRATKGSHIVSYTYDLAGIRDSKTVDGVTYNYITQNGQVVRQTWTSGGTSHVMDFIYDNTGKPYALKYDGTTYYYVLNLQGDVISIITHWGEAYGSYTYDAWGNVLSVSGDIANLNPIRYRGYYYDSETGLYYLGSRYYDPQVRRFINADGAAFATVNPYGEGLTDKNYFAYCDNNPVSRSDDGGELFKEVVIGAVFGAAVGAVASALDAAFSGKSARDICLSAGKGAVSGAVSGALSTAAAELKIVKTLSSVVISGGMEYVSQKRANPNSKIDWYNMATAVGSGLIGCAVSGASAKVVRSATRGLSRTDTKIVKAVVGGIKHTASYTYKFVFKGIRRITKN